MIKRSAKAIWKTGSDGGQGELSTPSTALHDVPYTFKTRFNNKDGRAGTNPEELIAAAHAGCFSMALSLELANAGFKTSEVETEAFVSVDKIGDKYEIRKVELNANVKADGLDDSRLQEIAHAAKINCPVSKALAVPIDLNAQLKGQTRQTTDSGKHETSELLT